MRVTVQPERTADLLYNAEQLYDDLRRADLLIEAAQVYEAVTDLRRRVREEQGE